MYDRIDCGIGPSNISCSSGLAAFIKFPVPMYVVMEFGLLIMIIHTGTKYITRTMKLLGMAVPYLKVPTGSFQGCPVYSVVIMLVENPFFPCGLQTVSNTVLYPDRHKTKTFALLCLRHNYYGSSNGNCWQKYEPHYVAALQSHYAWPILVLYGIPPVSIPWCACSSYTAIIIIRVGPCSLIISPVAQVTLHVHYQTICWSKLEVLQTQHSVTGSEYHYSLVAWPHHKVPWTRL